MIRASLLTCMALLLGSFLQTGALAEEQGKQFDAHAVSFHYFFEDGDMDFHFGNLVLGSAVNGGVEIGEAYYAASQIKDGDAKSWQKQWMLLADRVEKRGDKSLAQGHNISARKQYLRAAYYNRISLVSMLPDNPEFAKRGIHCRDLMKKAGNLAEPTIEYIEIPFENTKLPGYFQKARKDNKPCKTLLMIGGGETFAEDLYFYIADLANQYGYNFMTVDLPGQGLLPLDGHIFRTDTNIPMQKVVDYMVSRPDVDQQKLAAYGISGGGVFVPQAAMHDPRIKAIAMCSAVVDAYTLFSTMPAALATAEDIKGWTGFHHDVVRAICWRYGVDENSPSLLIDVNKGNTFDPEKIKVPALMIVGEGEYKSDEVQRQQKIALDGFENTLSKLVVTPSDEGGTNHCLMENRSMVAQVVFDWLDEVL